MSAIRIHLKEASIMDTKTMNNNQTSLLAQFASQLVFSVLPLPVIEQTKACLLDALGSICLGSRQVWGKIIVDYVTSGGSRPESIIVGSKGKVAASDAALANGTMAHGFEADDVHMPAIHHPGAVVIPSALAAAEREGASGQDFIIGVVAGYEVMNRVGDALTESHIMRGFFPTATNGPFGSAAAAGSLLHLTESQMAHALGIAGNQSAGLLEGLREGIMTKRLGAGRAAQSGLMAADLAKLGFTGPTRVLEGEWGYLKAYSDNADPFTLTRELGEDFSIKRTIFKPYPCCKALHGAIDGILILQQKHHFEAEGVEEIIIGGYEKLAKMHDIYELASIITAQFSMPYVVSSALLRGAPGVDAFTEKSISDPSVLRLARKVRTVVDPEIAPFFPAFEPCKVTVKLKGGACYSKTVIQSKGTPENPMSLPELEDKFREFAAPVFSNSRTQEIIEIVRHLETLDQITTLSNMLGKMPEP